MGKLLQKHEIASSRCMEKLSPEAWKGFLQKLTKTFPKHLKRLTHEAWKSVFLEASWEMFCENNGIFLQKLAKATFMSL